MNTESKYPYEDIVTPLLFGEIWRNIPDFEGSFQVSNLGRVKSLDRTVSHSRCGTQFVKGRILKQNIKRHYNNFKNDFAYILQVAICFENKRHDLIVRRLVFYVFNGWKLTQKFDGMIISSDYDGLNCRLDNLKFCSTAEHLRMLIQTNRTEFTKKRPNKENIKPTFRLWKPVSRCDVSGNLIETYPCIAHAANKFECYEKGISLSIRNKTIYRGFKWRLAPREFFDDLISQYPAIKPARNRKPKPPFVEVDEKK
ncbi:NUMOD4 domain-containing protein [Pedobacter sp. HMWF019]|uniref:NUMOD4 domain-containing protein n=1 Tax=Pedobacter sp. HMWF019 TaxID=2056856 RepID=UPI00130497D3|nr:NUMOD4 domain-containing protein [Pedobacter sp. HMWF019]